MKPVTKMIWLFIIIIIGSALCFVFLDDEDTRSPVTAPPAAGQQSGNQ